MIREKIRKYGIRKTLEIVFRRFLKTGILKFHYLRLNVNDVALEAHMKSFDLDDVKELTYEDFLKGDKIVFRDKKLALIRERLSDKNYKAFGIVRQSKLLYSTWVSMEYLSLPLVKKRIRLLPNEALLEDSYCSVEARGHGFHSQMNWYRISRLYNNGKNRILTIVLEGNIPAFKVQSKCGFEDLGVFYVISLLGINFLTLKKKRYDNK